MREVARLLRRVPTAPTCGPAACTSSSPARTSPSASAAPTRCSATHLEQRYETMCDPRLNARQSLDLAFQTRRAPPPVIAPIRRGRTAQPDGAVTDTFRRPRARTPGLVDELYRQFLDEPRARSPASGASSSPTTRRAAPAPATGRRRHRRRARRRRPTPRRRPGTGADAGRPGDRAARCSTATTPEPLRGAAARIVENMEASLERPDRDVGARRSRPSCSRSTARSSTTTSPAPARGKVSFTHLIALRGRCGRCATVPAMNSSFGVDDGKPDRRAPRAREPRPRGRRAAARRHAHAARPEHQGRRHARLRRRSAPRTRS